MKTLVTACAALCLLVLPAAAAQVRTETIDGKVIEGSVAGLTDGELIVAQGTSRQTLQRADVAEVVMAAAEEPMAKRGQNVMTLAGGGQLVAGELSMADGRFEVASAMLGKTQLPLSAVAMVYLPGAKLSPDAVARKMAEMNLGESAKDMLVVAKTDDSWLTVEGVLKGVDNDKITFNWNDADRTISRATVRAIRLAPSGAAPARQGVLVSKDGSAVAFTGLKLAGQTLTADVVGAGKAAVEMSKLSAIRFTSERVVNLGDLKPSAVTEKGFFDKAFAHRVNSSVGGGPLKMDGRVYRTGLGLHSFCELTYDLGGGYSTFVATVGIDDAVRPRGSAGLTFLADGKELGQKLELTGADKAQPIRLDVKGVKQLRIRVDFGKDNLDVADHVDIAAARLIK